MGAPAASRAGAVEASASLARVLTARDVAIAAISYVVASTTLVSDLEGWFTYGARFGWALAAAFVLNLLLCLSVAELAASFPHAGAIYAFTASVLAPRRGHRALGVLTAVVLVGTTILAGAGEISSGVLSLRALLGTGVDGRWLVLALVGSALVPNLVRLRTTARVALLAVVVMIGLRGLFGLVGLFGLGHTGPWSAANLGGAPEVGLGRAMAGGLGLAFWTFVGVEAVAPFAEEIHQAPRTLARGMIAALLVVLVTSLGMGLGILGTLRPAQWRALATGAAACGGDCPHIAVGALMLGETGRLLMALAAVASCYGTLMIGIGGLGRVLHALARDEGIFGRLSPVVGRATADGRPPAAALVTAGLLVVVPPMFARQVIPWLLPAALVWILLYVVYHLLVVVDRWLAPARTRPFQIPLPLALVGAIVTLAAAPLVFAEVEALGLLWRAATVLERPERSPSWPAGAGPRRWPAPLRRSPPPWPGTRPGPRPPATHRAGGSPETSAYRRAARRECRPAGESRGGGRKTDAGDGCAPPPGPAPHPAARSPPPRAAGPPGPGPTSPAACARPARPDPDAPDHR
jgi:amino acid transporter